MPSPSPEELSHQITHERDDKKALVIASGVVFLTVASLAVFLRLIARRLAHTVLKQDDWWIVGALISTTAYTITNFLEIKYGLGRHSVLMTNPERFMITAIVAESLYNVNILAIKMSILFLYRRIFPQLWFKQILLITGCLVVACGLGQVFGNIFQCVPIDSAWNPKIKGSCIHFGNFLLAMGIVNIITDVTILALPMPLLWKLKVSSNDKWMLMIMFSLGGFVCIISIVRLFFVRQIGSTDPSFDDVKGATVSAVECCVGITSACLPTYRPLHKYYAQGRWRVKETRTTSKPYSGKPIELNYMKSSNNKDWDISDDRSNTADDGPYFRLGNFTDVEHQPKMGSHVSGSHDIVVTKTFTSSNSDI